MLPIEGLIYQRRNPGAAPTENDRRDGDTLRIFPVGGDAWALRRRRGETRVRMRRLLLAGGPGIASPVRELRWDWTVHSLPPGLSMRSDGHIGEDRMVPNGRHHVGIGFRTRAGGDAEEAGLGIDGPQTAVGTWLHPANIFAHGPHLISQVLQRGHQHGEVGLATGARKRR